ncbi:hypothetical protein BXU09_17435 [Deinococcus sp. LM3]|nr:hypothetical protein BXU09_17435 [Deinococcus sp. LM3]
MQAALSYEDLGWSRRNDSFTENESDLSLVGLIDVPAASTGEYRLFLLSMQNKDELLFVLADTWISEGFSQRELLERMCAFSSPVKHSIVSHNGRHLVYHKGVELEQKIQVQSPHSAFQLARTFFGLAPDFGHPALHLEFLSEWQTYLRQVDLFERFSEGQGTGYVAFTLLPDGQLMVKEKGFLEDGLHRSERFVELLSRDTHLGTYLDTRFPDSSFEYRGRFDRWKFDFNVEFLTSGHIFSVGFDEVYAGDDCLKQVEIEYIRSRIHYGYESQAPQVEADLAHLSNHLLQLLHDGGVTAELTHLSKLSFLRMRQAGQPVQPWRPHA